MEAWKIIFPSKWVICRFHVNLPGCKGFPGKPSPFLFWIFFPSPVMDCWVPGVQTQTSLDFLALIWGQKILFSSKSTTWAEILNTKKCPHPLKLRWIPQKMMGRLENPYMFCSFKLWQQRRYILGIYFRLENSHVKTSHSLKSVVSSRWWKGKSYVLGEATDSVWIGSSEKMKRREVVKYQVVQSDLFGMVKT